MSTDAWRTHTLVPPTPGPLAAASNIGAGITVLITAILLHFIL